jgi:hypothetical protein
MQVINAVAAMRLGDPVGVTEDHMVIFHPNLGSATAKMIDVANRLGFQAVHDFSDQALQVQRLLAVRPVSRLFWEKGSAVNAEIENLVDSMRKTLGLGVFRQVYSRKPKHGETFFLRTVLDLTSYEEIEDGFGNYSAYGYGRCYGFMRRAQLTAKYRVTQTIYRWKGVSSKYVNHLCPGGISRKGLYMVHPWPGARTVGTEVVRILGELAHGVDVPAAKVLILGTLMRRILGITYEEELALYARLVLDIEARSGVDRKDIVFRPHPRFPVEALAAVRSSFPCDIDNSDVPLAECFFFRPGLEAVYSFGSTASVNAKKLFGLQSYIVTCPESKERRKNRYLTSSVIGHFGLQKYILGEER